MSDLATVATPIPRDRYGRPLVTPPDGSKPVPYTRATTYVGCLEDTYNLSRWQQRMVAIGLADRPDYVLAVTAHRGDKQRLNGICEQAIEAAKGSAAATTGTALHTLTEMLDRGADLPSVPADIAPDLHAYQAATDQLEYLAIEQFSVLDELRIGGTPDRIARWQDRNYICDLKGLSLTTPLATPAGWTTMGAIEVGDEVFDAFGKRCAVTAKSHTKKLGTYVVRFDDGSEIVCDSEHIWWTASGPPYNITPTAKPIDEVIRTLTYQGQKTHRVPVAEPLDLPDVDLPIDPYLLGCWLGDGHVRDGCITKSDDLFAILEADGHTLGVRQAQRAGKEHIATRTVIGLKVALRTAGLLHDKHIPALYLRASLNQRLRLLQGLMDTDGTWNTARRTAVFSSTDKALAHAVEELLLTLGQRPHLAEVETTGFGLRVTAYQVAFTPASINPFRLPRKADQAAASTKSTTCARRRVIVDIEPGPDVETACIAVDSPSRTYLAGERMVPTHNTGSVEWGAGKIAMQLAVYSRSVAYDHTTGARTPLSDVDQDRALIVHLPAGSGTCELLWVDIRLGWEAVKLATRVRAWRSYARNSLLTPAGASADATLSSPRPV